MPSDHELIERYAAGATKLRTAIEGLSPQELRARPGPGDWSLQELVIHVADSDFLATERMKRIVAEENPTLLVADENAWVAKLATDEQSAADACTLFELGRRQWARALRALPHAAFDRKGTHSIKGPQSLRDVLTTFTNHLDHHLKFAFEKRARLGK